MNSAGRTPANLRHAAEDREIIRSNRVYIEIRARRPGRLLDLAREFGVSYDVLRKEVQRW